MKKIILFLLVTFNIINAQDGTIDASFNIGSGLNSSIFCSIIQSDSKIILGGDFSNYNGTNISGIVRLNENGLVDTTLSTAGFIFGAVYCLEIQNDGKILAGGEYTSYNGFPANRIIRLNNDGSVDKTFNTGSGFSVSPGQAIYDIKSQFDGKIIVAGAFSSYNGIPVTRIIRLNDDGSIDNTFNIGTEASAVYSLAIQPDGKIIVGGSFVTFNGISKNRIVRLNTDGTVDNSFDIGTGFSGTVRVVVLQPDGKVIVGGNYNNYNGFSTGDIVRLNSDGTIDSSFSGLGGTNGQINTIKLQSNGKILIGGTFTNVNGYINYFHRLNNDGSLDSTFNNSGSGINNKVYTINLDSNEKILVGGDFTSYNGTNTNRLMRLNNPSVLSNATFNTSKLNLYPNPVNDFLNLELVNNETIENLKIYDITGKLVIETKEILNNQINVSTLQSGVYLLHIKTQNGVLKEKFVKN